MKRNLWTVPGVVLVILMMSLVPAYAGRNLQNAEYYVGLAEKYAREGTTAVLPDTLRSAEEMLGKATAEEQQDPKYGELRSRLEKIKGGGPAAETQPTTEASTVSSPAGGGATLNPGIVRWATKGLDGAEAALAGKTSLSGEEEIYVSGFLDQAKSQLDQSTEPEKATPAYIALQERYDKAQARVRDLAAARPAPAVEPTGRGREESTAAPAGGQEDTQKLIEEIENFEQAYQQAMATIRGAAISGDLQSMEAYDAVAAPGRRQMEKIKADFDAFVASHPETQDAQGHRDVWMAVQYAKRLNRPCDDRWFQQQRTTAQNLLANRQEQELHLKEIQERKAAWEKNSVLTGDRLRIYQERGIPQYWDGFFESKGKPESAAQAAAWTYFNDWYRVPTEAGLRQDVTIFYFKSDRLTRTQETINRSE